MEQSDFDTTTGTHEVEELEVGEEEKLIQSVIERLELEGQVEESEVSMGVHNKENLDCDIQGETKGSFCISPEPDSLTYLHSSDPLIFASESEDVDLNDDLPESVNKAHESQQNRFSESPERSDSGSLAPGRKSLPTRFSYMSSLKLACFSYKAQTEASLPRVFAVYM